MAFKRPRFWPLAFTLGGLAVTLALGTWQIERLHWKEGLIANIETARETAPMTTLPSDKEALEAKNFYYVKLRGSWVPHVEFTLAPRYFNDQFGYWVIAPFRLGDGRIVLVNRGWVPPEKKDPSTRPETKVSGYAVIGGMIRTGAERSFFTPKNIPEKDLWFGRDIGQMADYAHLRNVVPAMVDIVGNQDPAVLPIPSDGDIHLRNDHLSYIITWYGIAAGILVIGLTYHWEAPKPKTKAKARSRRKPKAR